MLPLLLAVMHGQARATINGVLPRPIDEKLYRAVQKGDAADVRTLLAKGASPNARLGYADSPLSEVGGSPTQRLAVARLLVAKGAHVNGNPWDRNDTPLTHAFYGPIENLALLRFLLTKGANPNRALSDLEIPLAQSVARGYVESARTLIAHGARLDARSKSVSTFTDPATAAEVFEPGFRNTGATPIFGLAAHWSPTMADLLLKAGASLKTTDADGWTPLHHAAHNGSLSAVVGLIARGADPNAASRGGYRPLHLALRAGFVLNPSTVQALLSHGADPKLRNKAGQTPLDLLRADAQRRVGNPSQDPEKAFPPSYLPDYQALVDATLKLLDPTAAPIVLALPKPNPKGQRYAPLDFFGGPAERTVRVEGDEAILELRLPTLRTGKATLTVKEVALEEYDTLTALPMVVRREKGVPTTLVFRFPKGAARGGSVNLAADQQGPGNTAGMMGQTSSEGDTNLTHPQPGFWFINGVEVAHEVPDRTMEFEVLSATRNGKPVAGLVGKILLVPSGECVPLPAFGAVSPGDRKTTKTKIVFRFRYLPNVRWLKGSIDL